MTTYIRLLWPIGRRTCRFMSDWHGRVAARPHGVIWSVYGAREVWNAIKVRKKYLKRSNQTSYQLALSGTENYGDRMALDFYSYAFHA